MKRGFAIFAAALMLTGMAEAQDIAPDITPARVDEFLSVMADNGCRMGNAMAEQVMPAAGFPDKAEVKDIVGLLMQGDRASVVDGQLIVHSGACGDAAPDYTTRERFLAAIAFNGCTMTAAQSGELLPPLGIKRSQIKPLIGQMISMGEVSLSQDNQVVFMEQYLCQSFEGMAEQIAGAKMAEARETLMVIELAKAAERTRFLTYMETMDCRVGYAELENNIPGAGLDFDLVFEVIDDLKYEGILLSDETGEVMTMAEGYCG